MAEAIMNPRSLRGYVLRGRLFVDSIERANGESRNQAGPDEAEEVPDLSETLHEMVSALCFLQVPMQAIEADDDKANPVYEELVCMQHGIDLLNRVYTNFDKGISALNRAQREEERQGEHQEEFEAGDDPDSGDDAG